MPARVYLFVSTGRCGSQWLTAQLSALYPDELVVAHEPIGPHYRPRDFFRRYDALDDMGADVRIADHLRGVADIPPSKSYVETGWPVFAAVPLFVERFGDAVSLVHLTRHPVPTALSHMVHKLYAGSARDDDYTRLAALDPWCAGAIHSQAAGAWRSFSPYERCLFWWTEVHTYAFELQRRYPSLPYLRVRAEDLLGDRRALEELAAFLGVGWNEALARARDVRVDRWHHQTDEDYEWRAIERHPETVALAAALGYDVDDVDAEALDRRYRGRPSPYTA